MSSLLTTTAIVHDPYAHTFDVVRRTIRTEVDDQTGDVLPHLVAETYLCERDTYAEAEQDLRGIMDDVANRGSGCIRRDGEPRRAS